MEERIVSQVLKTYGQKALLKYWNDLPPVDKKRLGQDILAIDWMAFPTYIKTVMHNRRPIVLRKIKALKPPSILPLNPRSKEEAENYAKSKRVGNERIRQGKVAMLTVAGGHGSRLGFYDPKGLLPFSLIKKKTLFQLLAEKIWRYGGIYNTYIQWYIMTSPDNEKKIRDFFHKHHYFNLQTEQVFFMVQGQLPVFSSDGNLLLSEKNRLFMAADGHGGCLSSLHKSGALTYMKDHGIEDILYFQIDNPALTLLDPLFIGLHKQHNSEISSRAICKVDPFEKVGVFCLETSDLRMSSLQVIEYFDIPKELAVQRNSKDNQLRFRYGNPAVHIFQRRFIERLQKNSQSMPLHRSSKRGLAFDPAMSATGEKQDKDLVKLELFTFDILPLAQKEIIVELDRNEEFAPIKNRSGQDSIESAEKAIQENYASWLTRRGIRVPRTNDGNLDCQLEISPLSYVDESDFQRADIKTLTIEKGERIYLS